MSDRVGSLCTGYGGLDGAAEAVFGGELVWVADNDPHVTTLLAERFPDVPNLGDITTQPDAESVDIVTAGFPCQPVSAAGRRKGTDDDRWIWNDIEAFIRRMEPRPRMLLLENVPGLLSANGGDAMARVVHGLASLGYVGRYGLLRAADVGACHRRERWFAVATRQQDGPGLARQEPLRDVAHSNGERGGTGIRHLREGQSDTHRVSASDSDGSGRRQDTGAAHGDERTDGSEHNLVAVGAGPQRLPTPTATDARGGRNATARKPGDTFDVGWTLSDVRYADRWGEYAETIALHEQAVDRAAPEPTTDGKLNPLFVEWMMMLPEGWVTDLDLPRTAQLRILGNGVVPAQAAAAYSMLDPVERKERKNG